MKSFSVRAMTAAWLAAGFGSALAIAQTSGGFGRVSRGGSENGPPAPT